MSARLSPALLLVSLAVAITGCDDGGGPASCVVDGVTHPHGSTFAAPDGCNTCQCHDGVAECTLLGCVTTCTYEGKSHPVGDSFPATDGCNVCTCQASGEVVCTQRACAALCTAEHPCDPSSGQFCRDPGASAGCGICFRVPPGDACEADAACDPGAICVLPACSCDGTTKTCLPGCATAADCGEGERCAPDHRCRALPCATPSDCPRNFRCDAGACLRVSCAASADCDDLCVNGRCWSEAGTCSYAVP